MPAVMAPSPITAMCWRSFSPFRREATAMPRAAEIEVEEWPTPKASYGLSERFRKTADAFVDPVGMEHLAATGQDLVAVSLVVDVPDQLVMGSIEERNEGRR